MLYPSAPLGTSPLDTARDIASTALGTASLDCETWVKKYGSGINSYRESHCSRYAISVDYATGTGSTGDEMSPLFCGGSLSRALFVSH